jgi:hypothetical protein
VCINTLAALIGLSVVFATASELRAWPPPPEARTMPGTVKGWLKSRWLAPYVSVTRQTAGATHLTTVRWLTETGELRRELSGANVDAQMAYVCQYGGGSTTVYAVNGDWKFVLPKKEGPAGYLTATEDSRTFVHEFHPREGEIAADIYVSGKLVGNIGPYLQYQAQDVHLGDDGSLALLTWKDREKKVPQVVGVGRDGKERFRADCDRPVLFPVPAMDGSGVLVKSNTGGDDHNTFHYYSRPDQTKNARVVSLNVGPNAWFVTWIPGTTTAVFSTSIGHDYRFHLIDFSTGKRLWDVADPNPARVPGAAPAITVVDDYVLIGGQEYLPWGARKEPFPSIYALSPRTGATLAHWLPTPGLQPMRDGGRFCQLSKKLFLVTDEEFAEINVKDIAAKANGWK